jgi:hypothetical protein
MECPYQNSLRNVYFPYLHVHHKVCDCVILKHRQLLQQSFSLKYVLILSHIGGLRNLQTDFGFDA